MMVSGLLSVFFTISITVYAMFILFSLWLLDTLERMKRKRTGSGLQREARPTQETQDLVSHTVVCEGNGQSALLGARKKHAVVVPKKKVTYSPLKPKIYVDEGNKLVELKELGANTLAKSTSSRDLKSNVAQAAVEVHAQDPIFKKVKLPKYKSDYQLVGSFNVRVSHILSLMPSIYNLCINNFT